MTAMLPESKASCIFAAMAWTALPMDLMATGITRPSTATDEDSKLAMMVPSRLMP